MSNRAQQQRRDHEQLSEALAEPPTEVAGAGRRAGPTGGRNESVESDDGGSGFADAVNAHHSGFHQGPLEREYNVTGPAPQLPAGLRTMPIARLRAMLRRLSAQHGTQNAPAMIAIRNALLAHPMAQCPQPLDQQLLGGFDLWEADAARYREYLRLVARPAPRGHVEMGELTRIRHPHFQNPVPQARDGRNQPAHLEPQGNGDQASQAAGSIDHIDPGGIPHRVHEVADLLHGLATLGEIMDIVGVHAAAPAEIVGPAMILVGLAMAAVDAFDSPNQLAQLEGFCYGVVNTVTRQSGPTRDQYPPGSWGFPPTAGQLDRWARGIAQGRAFVAQHRDAQIRLAFAIVQDGGTATLNAIFQRGVSALSLSGAASGIRLRYPGPGFE